MAQLHTDILGKVIYFYELPQIEISHYGSNPLQVVLSTDDRGRILDESYWPDFSQKIYIDIKDLVASELSLEIPAVDEDLTQASIYKVFHLSIGDEIAGSFTVNGFSSDVSNKISDIDVLRVPEDYMLPIFIFNNADKYSMQYIFGDGTTSEGDDIVTNVSGVGTTSRMIHLPTSPAAGKKFFRIKLSSPDTEILSPVYEVTKEHMEQYLFINRYGGFDNIPMSGMLDFRPDLSFESGSYNNRNEMVSSDSEYVYEQNSGFLSGKVMELMSELLCGSQIYHLGQDGIYRPIVILDSTLNSKSSDYLHSFSFRYKYADDVRPLSLKGKTAGMYVRQVTEPIQTLMFQLTESPMIIRHNRSGYPCVTVTNSDNQVVTVAVEYLDQDSISIEWNGLLSGYAYIR